MVQVPDGIRPLGCIDSPNPVYPGLWRRCHLYSDHTTFSDGNTNGNSARSAHGDLDAYGTSRENSQTDSYSHRHGQT